MVTPWGLRPPARPNDATRGFSFVFFSHFIGMYMYTYGEDEARKSKHVNVYRCRHSIALIVIGVLVVEVDRARRWSLSR